MNKTRIVLVMFLLSVTAAAALSSDVIRITLSTLTDLSPFSLREGELFYDEVSGTAGISDGSNEFLLATEKKVNEVVDSKIKNRFLVTENLPSILTKPILNGTEQSLIVSISRGSVVLNGKMYENTNAINCKVGNGENSGFGAGGYDAQPTADIVLAKMHYVYLISDYRVGYESNFNCILSESSSGPTFVGSSYDWKLVSASRTADRTFESINYSVSPLDVSFTTPTTGFQFSDYRTSTFPAVDVVCDEMDGSAFSNKLRSYLVGGVGISVISLDFSAIEGQTFSIFTSSDCSLSSQIFATRDTLSIIQKTRDVILTDKEVLYYSKSGTATSSTAYQFSYLVDKYYIAPIEGSVVVK